MNHPRPTTHDVAETETSKVPHDANQPYASELDDRELEHAHKEKRPVSPNGAAITPDADKPGEPTPPRR